MESKARWQGWAPHDQISAPATEFYRRTNNGEVGPAEAVQVQVACLPFMILVPSCPRARLLRTSSRRLAITAPVAPLSAQHPCVMKPGHLSSICSFLTKRTFYPLVVSVAIALRSAISTSVVVGLEPELLAARRCLHLVHAQWCYRISCSGPPPARDDSLTCNVGGEPGTPAGTRARCR